jgi:cobalt transporter subunit CbtA
MFRTIVYTAVLAGVIGGIFVSVVQAVGVVPLILEGETYEVAADTQLGLEQEHESGLDPGEHGVAWAPEGLFERTAFTVAANFLAAVGYSLLLAAGFAVTGSAGHWHAGLLWGLAGFAAFALAPALGLHPELPGAATSDLLGRQVWWLATAGSTAAGLALVLRSRQPYWAALGILLIVLPHLLGAPEPDDGSGAVPEALARTFVVASLVTNFLFWAVLGAATGFLYGRFTRPA